MEPTVKRNNWFHGLTILVGVGLFSLLQYWGTGLYPIWWVTWLAPIPILMVSSRLGSWSAFGLTALGFVLGGLNLWHFMVNVLGTPAFVVLTLLIVSGCAFGIAVVCFQRFLKSGEPLKAALGFSVIWVSWEYLNLLLSPHGTSLNLAYTQMDNHLVIQLASLTGVWGISFCLFFVAATVAVLFSHGVSFKAKGPVFFISMALMIGVLGYGGWRLALKHGHENDEVVVLLVSDSLGLFPREDAPALELLKKYAKAVTEFPVQKPGVFVLPEKIALVSDQAFGEVDSLFQTTAKNVGAYLVVGVDRGTLAKRSNEARVYSPVGELAGVYVKHHLLPPLEAADIPGDQLLTLPKGSDLWGFEICKDMDFPGLSRQYGALGVGLLLVPAWDFQHDSWLHCRMAVMRGVENGFSIARNAKQGRLTVSDECGRILGEASSTAADGGSPFSSIAAIVPVRSHFTLYKYCGDWFAWVNLVALLGILFGGKRQEKLVKAG